MAEFDNEEYHNNFSRNKAQQNFTFLTSTKQQSATMSAPHRMSPSETCELWETHIHTLDYLTTIQFLNTHHPLHEILEIINRDGQILMDLAENGHLVDIDQAKNHVESLRKTRDLLREHGAKNDGDARSADVGNLDVQLRVVDQLIAYKEGEIQAHQAPQGSGEKETK
ncbi:MAG: hypothetical protein Q9168_003542 [Polycauliona sp. 1 TL-2023]